MSEYATISGRSIAEIEEKKSRFIAHLAHVESEEEALSFLEEIRTEHRMARHNVYAYILRGEGASERIRYSDDGEPQKTAGLPTLQTLRHTQLALTKSPDTPENIAYTLLMPSVSLSGHLGGALGGLIGMFMVPSKNLRVPAAVRALVSVLWLCFLVYLGFWLGLAG